MGWRQAGFIAPSTLPNMGFMFTKIRSAPQSHEGDQVMQAEVSNAEALPHTEESRD